MFGKHKTENEEISKLHLKLAHLEAELTRLESKILALHDRLQAFQGRYYRERGLEEEEEPMKGKSLSKPFTPFG